MPPAKAFREGRRYHSCVNDALGGKLNYGGKLDLGGKQHQKIPLSKGRKNRLGGKLKSGVNDSQLGGKLRNLGGNR